MERHIDEGEVALVYVARFREYGIQVLDGGCAIQMARFCPWCGTRLPESLRELWFERLEVMGYEVDLFSDEIPDAFKSDDWWRSM